jgi:hypothetical protein
MADSAVPSRALSDRTAIDRDLSSETENFMGYDSPRVSSRDQRRASARAGFPGNWLQALVRRSYVQRNCLMSINRCRFLWSSSSHFFSNRQCFLSAES